MQRETSTQRLLSSPYLSRLSGMGFEEKSVDIAFLEDIIKDVKLYAQNQPLDVSTEHYQAFLIKIKSRFVFYWSIAHITQSISFSELGRLQSQFAESTIDLALHAAWYSDSLKQIAKFLPNKTENQPTEPVPGLFVLGLGKLGGLDLNFSSDVDLVAYYDAEKLPIPNTIGQGYIVNKALQEMSKILRNDGKIDFIWRVDWRLRPDSSSSLLSLSTTVAHEYYFFKALPWHRLALMKARPVAGDIDAGDAFMQSVESFIWRQNLDFSAMDELAHIKKRINLEHPNLRHQRMNRDAVTHAGFNVKLGNGGIREIEFIVNALQLLWGGKQRSLRCTNTLQALMELKKAGHLQTDLADKLEECYCYLRELENAIQMLNNVQTHLIPTDPISQEQLLSLLGFEANELNWKSLCDQVLSHRQIVGEFFQDFFAGNEIHDDDYQIPEDWEDLLNDRAKSVLKNWTTGFTDYGLPGSMAVVLDPLSNKLLEAVFESGSDINNSFVIVDSFLATLSNTSQYFRLLISHPNLIDSIVPSLLHSPHVGKLLKQSPHIVDRMLDPSFFIEKLSDTDYLKQQSEFIFSTNDYGVRLESIRRFVNEILYQSYLAFMQGKITVKKFQQCLTRLAECTLECSLEIAREELKLPNMPMAVLGMGKLAMSRMSPLSDLDLIFIFDDDFPLEDAQKVVSRLQTILGMQLKEGIAYELDTRLRPSGKSGPPTVFLNGFREHHLNRAKNWEHIALLPSRIVAGDKEIGEKVIQVKREVFSQKRDRNQWLNDAKKMWHRINQHRIKDVDNEIIGSKLRRGGLMQSEYLAVCQCIDNFAEPSFYEQHESNIDDFVCLLSGLKATVQQQADLDDSIQFWSTVQIWERLLGLENKRYSDIADDYFQLMLSHLCCDSLVDFFETANKKSNSVEQAMDDYFSLCELYSEGQIEDWQETNVIWQS